ncbi:MAG: hypothetical protein LBS36_04175 [Oscillospiraceae bacterium]|nr:hypothetical protein [Oscillospiraceae bacterium]
MMEQEKFDFAKRFDDYIDQSSDCIRDVAKQFYAWGLADGRSASRTVIYIPYPVENKKYGKKFETGIQER